VRKLVGLPKGDSEGVHELQLVVQSLTDGTTETFGLRVATPAAFVDASGFEILSDRALLAVSDLDRERIRTYLTGLVRACDESTFARAIPIFERYFEHAVSVTRPRHPGKVTVRGFDPAWSQGLAHSQYMTFGVATRSDAVDTEMSVTAVTPAGLRERAAEGAFVLGHRALIVCTQLDERQLRAHVEHLVAVECAAASVEMAMPRLQRYFRADWEEALVPELEAR
jgi:hypothetical protein